MVGCPQLRTIEIPAETAISLYSNPFINNPNLIIVCEKGSDAEKWANKYNYQYKYYGSDIIYNQKKEPNEKQTWEVNKDTVGIVVYKKGTQEYISGAVLEINGVEYTTDNKGFVSIAATSTKEEIYVHADNYESICTIRELKGGSIIYIDVPIVSDDLAIISIKGTIEDENKYDLLNEKLVLGYVEDMSAIIADSEKNLVLTVEGNRRPELYFIL